MGGIMLRHGISPPSVRTPAKMFDKLIDHFVTDRIVQPTFVCDHPLFMSPLAKAHEPALDPKKAGLSERFELFINGMEIANSYSELTDPVDQLRRFERQLKDKEMGDDEAMGLDDTFLKSLQVGLPPTAGWGMGIDRVLMLLTTAQSIRDVVLFPQLKPDTSHDAKRRAKSASFFGVNDSMANFCLSAMEAKLKERGEHESCEKVRDLRRVMRNMQRERSRNIQDRINALEVLSREMEAGKPVSPLLKALVDVVCGRLPRE